jgi:hypothetical protein
MKYTVTFLLILATQIVLAQQSELTTDSSVAIPRVKFDAKGGLIITASATSANNDFDFLAGKWKMYHRRLNKRLVNCRDWTEFVSWDENESILAGKGNVDTYRTSEMPGMEGQAFEGFTLRTYDPKNRLWSLYWVASNEGVLDPPMVGSFENNIGHFFCKDTYNGKPVLVVFRWDARNKERPIWSQAFSADNGKTWEWNWYNVSERVK